MFRTTDGSPWLRYGQTPVALQKRDFGRLAEYLGTTLEEAAESVLAMSPLERAELLQRFYTSVGLSGAKDAYEVIKEEIEKEEKELREARERLQEDPEETGEEEDGASLKTTVIAKRHTKKIPHQTGESAFGHESAEPPISEPVLLETQSDSSEGGDDNGDASSLASLSVLKPPPAESYSRKRSSVDRSGGGAGSFKSRCLTGEAYYDSILNPKSIKLDDDVGPEKGSESDTEEALDRRSQRRTPKPAPEEEYQSRSKARRKEKQPSVKSRGIASMMDEYDKLLN